MIDLFLGIDVGTSGVKVVAVDAAGSVRASEAESFDFDRPQPGWAETPPSRWWDATVAASRRLTAGLGSEYRLAAAGLSGQMHGSVFLDASSLENAGTGPINGLAPALMWNDQRTEPQRARIESLVGGRRKGVEATGCPSLCGLTAPKLLWFREHQPDVASHLAGVCLPKDYIALALTGAFAGDVGDGSGTMLVDPMTRDWNPLVLESLGIDRALLPDLVESGTVVGRITTWAAGATGLPEGMPVAIGSGDNQTAAVGAGVVDPGEVLAIVGTSGVVLAPAAKPTPDLGDTPGRLNLFCDATGRGDRTGHWMLSGCMLSAAGSLEWARQTLAPDVSFEQLVAEAGEVSPGCDGLVFLPYLTGERCPIPDPEARGGWIGLTRSHTRGHMIRAVLEGVSFGLAQIMDIVRESCGPSSLVRVTGGGAKSPIWRQILADAFGVPVAPLSTSEGSALGAAAIAAHAASDAGDIREITSRWVTVGASTEPHSSRTFSSTRSVYDGLYADLRNANAALAAIATADNS